MRPQNLGFEDCDIIPYCRITESNTKKLEKDTQNRYRNPKKDSKLPIPRDLDLNKQVVNTYSNSKTEHDSDTARDINQKPKNCEEFEPPLQSKSTYEACNHQSSSSQECSSENSSKKKSSEDSCLLEGSEKVCTDSDSINKYPHYSQNEDSNSSTSSAMNLTSKQKQKRNKLYRNRSYICHKNKTEYFESSCKIPRPDKHKKSLKCELPKVTDSQHPNFHGINCKDLCEKMKNKCSENNLPDYSNTCYSYCPHSKQIKNSCKQKSCNECKKFYASILSSIFPKKSTKHLPKNKQSFEGIYDHKEVDQLSQSEIEECIKYLQKKISKNPLNSCQSGSGSNSSLEKKNSYEGLCQKKPYTKCPTTEKTYEDFGATSSSQPKINEIFCRDASKNQNLEEDLLEKKLMESKDQDCQDFSVEESRQPNNKKKCDCKDKTYCKIDPENENVKKQVEDLNLSICPNIGEKKPISKCSKRKQSFEDFCKEKEKEKLSQHEETSKCSENNKLKSNLSSSNTCKRDIVNEAEKKSTCGKSNENKDLRTYCESLFSSTSSNQIKRRKCCCKGRNNNKNILEECKKDQDKNSRAASCLDTDLCGKKSFIKCPRKKQSFEDFCKEKEKMSRITENECCNRARSQKNFCRPPQHVEHKLLSQKNLGYCELESDLSISSPEKSITIYSLENRESSMKLIRELKSGSDSSSCNSINLSAPSLLLKNQKCYLREYSEDGERGSNQSLSNQKQETAYRESQKRKYMISNLSPKNISQSYPQTGLSEEIKFSQKLKNDFHSDNDNKWIIKRLQKDISKQDLGDSLKEDSTIGTKLCGKWSLCLKLIQNESDEELCRQYDEYLSQQEGHTEPKHNTTSSHQHMSLSQSDCALSADSSNTYSTSIKNLHLKIEMLPSSIPGTGEGPLKSNKENKVSDNCLSMLLGSGAFNKSAIKTFTPKLLLSTMESESGTKKCFTNPMKIQTNLEENKNVPASDSANLNHKKEDSTCKVTINRLTTVKEDDEKLSLNKDESTKERPIPLNLSYKITSLDKETIKAFSDAHSQTMATIRYAMQDIAGKVYKTTSEVATGAVTRIQSESAKPIEIIKNYKQSEDAEFKKYINDNIENKLQIFMHKVNGGSETEPPFYKKMYEQANDTIQSAMLFVTDSAVGKITAPNYNDQSSAYDVPNPNLYNENSTAQEVSHVVNPRPMYEIFAFIKAKFWTLFTNSDKGEETMSSNASDTSVSTDLNESETESDEDLMNKLIE